MFIFKGKSHRGRDYGYFLWAYVSCFICFSAHLFYILATWIATGLMFVQRRHSIALARVIGLWLGIWAILMMRFISRDILALTGKSPLFLLGMLNCEYASLVHQLGETALGESYWELLSNISQGEPKISSFGILSYWANAFLCDLVGLFKLEKFHKISPLLFYETPGTIERKQETDTT